MDMDSEGGDMLALHIASAGPVEGDDEELVEGAELLEDVVGAMEVDLIDATDTLPEDFGEMGRVQAGTMLVGVGREADVGEGLTSGEHLDMVDTVQLVDPLFDDASGASYFSKSKVSNSLPTAACEDLVLLTGATRECVDDVRWAFFTKHDTYIPTGQTVLRKLREERQALFANLGGNLQSEWATLDPEKLVNWLSKWRVRFVAPTLFRPSRWAT